MALNILTDSQVSEYIAGLDLAELYLPQSLGEPAARAGDSIGVRRSVADYIAGMTDRFLEHDHQRRVGDG